jgi:UDP-N-acetylmuramyl pentapeptide phosphotransferase/UDP-N-acetylglucosamine-1-phosphate transferase
MIWNKSKTQIITIAVSIALIMLIGSIYDDLYKVVKISSKDDLILLLFAKWILILLIIGLNWKMIKKIKFYKNNDCIDSISNITHTDKNSKTKQILSKTKLKTKTDIILEKYKK